MDAIYITDNGTTIGISYNDLIKYHGRSYTAGVAMAYKMMELAFDKLGFSKVISRERLEFRIAVNGPGIIDAIEMVSRAKTHSALTVDQNIASDLDAPDAADGQGGKYYFEVIHNGEKILLTLKSGLIPGEFIDISNKYHAGTITCDEKIRLKELKEYLAESIMNTPSAELFHVSKPSVSQ